MSRHRSNPGLRSSTSLLAFLTALASSPALSQFRIEIESELNDLEVELSPITVGNQQAIVVVENKNEIQIQCTGWFRNGPEREERRVVMVEPEQRRQLAVRLERRPVVVRVRVECIEPAADSQEAETGSK